MTIDFVLQLIIGLGAAAGVYAAIKSDLTRAIITAEQALLDAGKAHNKIDTHMNDHWKGAQHGS